MIVDANVFGGFWFDTTFASYAVRLRDRHAERLLVPSIWRSELMSIALYAIEERGVATLEAASRIRDADAFFEGRAHAADPALVLQLARERNLSTYDAEYLALAVDRGVPLITGDREFFERARHVHDVRWVERWDTDGAAPTRPTRAPPTKKKR